MDGSGSNTSACRRFTEPIMTALRFSVVIPTYQRRDVVCASVAALARQEFGGAFEVIVVVDGSTDGTAAALRRLSVPFPLTVLEQSNQGASQARNHGANIARGEILLFLDDDMESDPRLLSEHDQSHRAGADVVLGHIPLHPDSPPSVLTQGVRDWAEQRARRLSVAGATLTLHDLLTGQMSLRKEIFAQVGGFDTDFTCGGSFGNEDVDFGYRLLQRGEHIVFNPAAISWQKYIVRPSQYLRQYRQAGRADVIFVRKHPDQAKAIFTLSKFYEPSSRLLWRPLAALHPWSAPVTGAIRRYALHRAERGDSDLRTAKWLKRAKRIEYFKGVREAGGVPRHRALRVLAYHSISNTNCTGFFKPYVISPSEFERQIAALLRAGYEFVSVEEALQFLRGDGGLPRRPVLLTFDDCYQDVLDNVLPVLRQRRIPAVVFAVTGRVGGTNEWDAVGGAPEMRLLDAEGLRKLAANGIEIGAHSRTHKRLPKLAPADLVGEVAGSVSELQQLGFGRPRLFSYPFGESNEAVRRAVRETGVLAAFSIMPGFVCTGQDPFQIPRIEILRDDTGWRFRWKVALAGPLTGAWQRWMHRWMQAGRSTLRVGRDDARWLASFVAGRAMPQPAYDWLRTKWIRHHRAS
jgi:peptidoglycan/xylan/chitin deacetylase (PgdA/CDA1 family)/glycosyltransferase involved in cell wall biosynthesis